MNQIAELEQQIEDAKKEKLVNSPFKVNDCVEILEGEKSFKGHIETVYISSFGDDKGLLTIKVTGAATSYIGWTGNYKFVKEPFTGVRHIENPVRLSVVEGLDNMIWRKGKEIDAATKLLKSQKSRLQDMLKKERAKCIHSFTKGNATGETRKHLVGESEVHEYTCSHCGLEVESV